MQGEAAATGIAKLCDPLSKQRLMLVEIPEGKFHPTSRMARQVRRKRCHGLRNLLVWRGFSLAASLKATFAAPASAVVEVIEQAGTTF